MVCPLCEHSQTSGDACDNCGRELVAAWDAPVRVETVAGLESGRAAPATENIQALSTLEVTLQAPAPDAPASSLSGLEQTQFPANGNFVPEVVQGLDRGREIPQPTPFDPEGAVTCRACGHQQRGSVCERCGMRLPRYRPAPEEPEITLVVCHNCNVRQPAGERCEGCGMMLPLPQT